ncbi:MAG TPA: sigma-54-dependent Fis family transcriptional regulator [Bacteroidetes bacterium]|nr:sigma-54-dependent Fis family transcriptional regulator [Bacteroidota bacterium]
MGIIGVSPAIQQVRETIRQVAPTSIPVLIEGESGTGKELVAKAIHEHSPRRNKKMFTVNCGAIPEGILESELFGHQRGAFTGAVESRKGYFELADGSTLFLDEIGDMPLHTQVKVLRVLEQKEFMRVGGSTYQRVDVRILAATNKNLAKEVREGRFRRDLYYRLNAVKIFIPPLRERPEDIPLLVEEFQREFCKENQIDCEGFDEEAIALLQQQPWPGNVRELRNVVQSVIVLERGKRITADVLLKYLPVSVEDNVPPLPVPTHKSVDQAERELIYRVLLELKSDMNQIKQLLFSQFLQPKSLQSWRPAAATPVPAEVVNADVEEIRPLEEMEREMILKALQRTNWSKRKAAKLLGISERTLYRKINEYKLQENL